MFLKQNGIFVHRDHLGFPNRKLLTRLDAHPSSTTITTTDSDAISRRRRSGEVERRGVPELLVSLRLAATAACCCVDDASPFRLGKRPSPSSSATASSPLLPLLYLVAPLPPPLDERKRVTGVLRPPRCSAALSTAALPVVRRRGKQGKKAATTACCLEDDAGGSHEEGDVAAATNHDYVPSPSPVAITVEFGNGRGEPPSCSLFTAERGENTATFTVAATPGVTKPPLGKRPSPSSSATASSPLLPLLYLVAPLPPPLDERKRVTGVLRPPRCSAALSTAALPVVRRRGKQGKKAATTACCLEDDAGGSHEEGDVAAATNHDYVPSPSPVAITVEFGNGQGEPPSCSLFTAERGENTATFTVAATPGVTKPP
nr:hypothetical protein Iba_chr02cCG7240 [Ipomoea batatas]